jgi:hypothetical protein
MNSGPATMAQVDSHLVFGVGSHIAVSSPRSPFRKVVDVRRLSAAESAVLGCGDVISLNCVDAGSGPKLFLGAMIAR